MKSYLLTYVCAEQEECSATERSAKAILAYCEMRSIRSCFTIIADVASNASRLVAGDLVRLLQPKRYCDTSVAELSMNVVEALTFHPNDSARRAMTILVADRATINEFRRLNGLNPGSEVDVIEREARP